MLYGVFIDETLSLNLGLKEDCSIGKQHERCPSRDVIIVFEENLPAHSVFIR